MADRVHENLISICWTGVILIVMIVLFERPGSLASDSNIQNGWSNLTSVLKSMVYDNQSTSESISTEFAQDEKKTILKSWFSLGAATLLSCVVSVSHSRELVSTHGIQWNLIGLSLVITGLGNLLGLLAIGFVQLIGYALIGSIFLSSISGYYVAVYLHSQIQAKAISLVTVHAILEKIKPTPPSPHDNQP